MTLRLMSLITVQIAGLLMLGSAALAVSPAVAQDDPPRPPITVNEFFPTERSLSECLSVLPKPGCGSEARGGWAQTAVFIALIGGLGIIMTRVIIGVRGRNIAGAATATADAPAPPATPPGD